MNLPPQARAVARALEAIDARELGAFVGVRTPTRDVLEEVLGSKRNASDKVALLYFLSYKLEDPAWGLRRVPIGYRPQDKILASGLTERHLTLHQNITSFGENMGIKGNAKAYDLFARKRLGPALRHCHENPGEVLPAFTYVAQRFKDSFSAPIVLDLPAAGELVYTRALTMVYDLISAESGGHFPQFLVAGLLRAFHEQCNTGRLVRTYHPNASDKFGGAAGDVEVVAPDGTTVEEGYEVTVRPDWKNRRQDLVKKAQAFGLSEYNVICLMDGEDAQLADAGVLHKYMAEMGHDIAVVDIRAFASMMLQMLERNYRQKAFEYVEAYLRDDRISGVPQLIERFKEIVEGA